MSPLKFLIATAVACCTLQALPVSAQEATPWPELWMKTMDTNGDGMVTKQEYLDAMGKMWDEKHAKMMKTDKSMKPGMMNKTQFMTFAKGLTDPGQIGGN